MSNKEDFYFDSSSGTTRIHAVLHIPETEIKAILQISHGMVEFIDRYDDFAGFLNSNGILVAGNDHLGHGKSIISRENYGYFAEREGNAAVLNDLHKLTGIVKDRYPDVPYFLFGHSMGSFYARQYLCEFGGELDGAIVMGTGYQRRILVKLGKMLSSIMGAFKGWHYRSHLIDDMAFGGYNKHFEPSRTPKDWLTKDDEIVDAYLSDERCTFIFTLNAYYNMFKGIDRLYDRSFLEHMPKELPVLFVSGEDDPVGEFSKGVLRAVKSFDAAGMKNVRLKLYPGDRHEILNETDRLAVYEDICTWIEDVLASLVLQ